MAQRKAARFVFNDYSRYSSVSNMLHQLNWETLKKYELKPPQSCSTRLLITLCVLTFQTISKNQQQGQEATN